MFQPNRTMRYSVPQNEVHHQLPMAPPNDCRLPTQMHQNPHMSNHLSNFAPPHTVQHSVVMTFDRPTISGPPPFIGAPSPHYVDSQPPHFLGDPPPFLPPHAGTHGSRPMHRLEESYHPPTNMPLHMPPPPPQHSNNVSHGRDGPRMSMDTPFTDIQGHAQFKPSQYHSNETSRHSFDSQENSFGGHPEFFRPDFQPPDFDRHPPDFDRHQSNMFNRPPVEPVNSITTDIEDFSRSHKNGTEDYDFDEEPKSSFDKYRREKDQTWIESWLKRAGKWKPSTVMSQRKSSDIVPRERGRCKIPNVQEAFHKSIIFLAKLQHQCRSMESMMSSVDPQVWEAEKNLTEEYRDKCVELHQYLNNEELLREIKIKMESRRKKRTRLKKQRKEASEADKAAMERRDNLHQQLEEWKTKMTQLAEDEKQKAELKKSADSTLSAVRKKISDAKKTQEVLKGLQKLRKVRRVAAVNQGRYSSDAYDIHFEKKMEDLTNLMTKQQTVYETEEKTLKVMLEAVEEETMEREKEIKRQKERAKERLEKKLTKEKIFGKNIVVPEDDDLHPFNMYYTQAEHNLDALIQIRHEWDMHLVPPNIHGGSRVPDGYIVPGEPTSDIWATALK